MPGLDPSLNQEEIILVADFILSKFKNPEKKSCWIDAIAQSTKQSVAKPVNIESNFWIYKAVVLIERAQSTEAKQQIFWAARVIVVYLI